MRATPGLLLLLGSVLTGYRDERVLAPGAQAAAGDPDRGRIAIRA